MANRRVSELRQRLEDDPAAQAGEAARAVTDMTDAAD
jgi:hypothetical protein